MKPGVDGEVFTAIKVGENVGKLSTTFLKVCIAKKLAPKFITRRIKNAQIRHSPTIERVFLTNEISANESKLDGLKSLYKKQLDKVQKFLSFFDWIRFCRYLAEIEIRKRDQIQAKHFSNLNWMRKQHFGTAASVIESSIVNLSKYDLSDTEKFVLAHGREFCLPPSKINREEVFAKFEVLIGQLLHHTPKSKESASTFTAKLNNLAHSYCDSPIGRTYFFIHHECFQAMKSLRSNSDILITKEFRSGDSKQHRLHCPNGNHFM